MSSAGVRRPPEVPRLAVVVLAAGKGTRLKSDLPKVLHSLAGRPLIHHVLAAVRPLHPVRTVVVVGHGAAAVRVALAGDPSIECVDQVDQHGTGHAVLQARDALDGQSDCVLVLYGDVPLITTPTLRALIAAFEAGEAPLAILTNLAAPTAGLGRIVRDAAGRFRRIVEEREATAEERSITETNSGIGIYSADWLWRHLPTLAPSRSGEIYLTDLAAAAIHVDVAIGAGTEIGPACRIGGPTVIGERSVVGADCDLRAIEMAGGARVDAAWIHGYRIGRSARIGPGACLIAAGGNVREARSSP